MLNCRPCVADGTNMTPGASADNGEIVSVVRLDAPPTNGPAFEFSRLPAAPVALGETIQGW